MYISVLEDYPDIKSSILAMIEKDETDLVNDLFHVFSIELIIVTPVPEEGLDV